MGNDIGTSLVTVCLLRSENDLKNNFTKFKDVDSFLNLGGWQ